MLCCPPATWQRLVTLYQLECVQVALALNCQTVKCMAERHAFHFDVKAEVCLHRSKSGERYANLQVPRAGRSFHSLG